MLAQHDHYFNVNKNYLEDLVLHMFDCKVPETIDTRYLLKKILFEGYCTIFKYRGKTVASTGALSGIGEYYKPVWFTPAEPFFVTSKRYTVGKDCIAVYNSDNYVNPERSGLNELINIFAERLTQIDISIDTSIENSRVTLIPVVTDVKDAERTREIIEKMRAGEAAVLSYRTSLGEKNYDIMPISARDTCVIDILNDARRNIINTFLDYIGVDNNQVDKKERTNLMEISSNDVKLRITLDRMLEPIKYGFDLCNKMFGGGFDINLKEYIYYKEETTKEVDADAGKTLPSDNRED